MAEAPATTTPTSAQALELAKALLGDGALFPEAEKAATLLLDDEYERLARDEQRKFWGEVLRRELKRKGVSAGVLGTSTLGAADSPPSRALAEIEKSAGAAVKEALARIRSVAIDCPSCESLSLVRFKAEDDRCRVCGALLPTSPEFGKVRGVAEVVASLEAAPATTARFAKLAPEPAFAPTWEVVSASPDLKRLLVLSKENVDWDERVLEEKRAVERVAREKAEVEAKKKAEVERVAREKAEAEARKKAEAERVVREKAEAEARKKAEEAAKLAEIERAAKAAAEAEAAKIAAEEEAERQRKAEDSRLAIGVLTGEQAGKIIRIEELDPKLKPSGKRPLIVFSGGSAKILVPSGTRTYVDGKAVQGIVALAAGNVVRGVYSDEDLVVIDENGDLRGVNADPIHFTRDENEPGGPWNYWNEPVKIGASPECAITLVDRGVDEVHATVATRFGRVVIEDACTEADGLWIDDKRVPSFVATPGLMFRLGSKGPFLNVNAGTAEVKQVEVKGAGAMKPARYVRTCLHISTASGAKSKIFMFARREIRFGRLFSKDEGQIVNDLVISPEDDMQTVADKQGSLSLSRDGVTLRLDDKKVPMTFNEEELKPGQSVPLKRRFSIDIGDGSVLLEGEVFRAPTTVKRESGPGQLGVEGGHPYECVRMVREGASGHTYVYLVRQVRIGSGPNDSIQLHFPGVAPNHATINMSRGVFQIIAPRAQHKVKLDGQTLETGVPYPLKLGAKILLGEVLIRLEVTQESDFQVAPVAVA